MPRRSLRPLFPLLALAVALALLSASARAQDSTPGFSESIMQWGVQPGQTCADISQAVYGSPAHTDLLLRYNGISCGPGSVLAPGLTLVLPAKVSHPPAARLTNVNPEVRARSGGGWGTGFSGQPLGRGSNVNTLAAGRAGIQFLDRTRIYLGPDTLVVIYDTARGTAVSKVAPAAVELEHGELQAGLAALRGRPVQVAVTGGGEVSAASKDTVVARKGKRTTVGVFQGSAQVTSAGASVQVPLNHGTHFVEAAPPAKPRPLPPAPVWKTSSPPVLLAEPDQAVITATWEPVPGAKSYRFEVSTSASFEAVVVREEVGASVLAFRAERFPAGRYYLRVRAIDGEDYLGIASSPRATLLLTATWREGAGRLDPDSLEASPYGVLRLGAAPGHLLAFDGGAFGPPPEEIDFARVAPTKLRWRRESDDAEHEVAVRYLPVTADVQGLAGPTGVDAVVSLAGVEGLDVPGTVGPRLQVRRASGLHDVALVAHGPAWRGSLGFLDDPVRVDVVDKGGRLLGTARLAPDAQVVDDDGVPRVGPTRPLPSLSARANTLWLGPRLRTAASLGVAIGRDAAGRTQTQGSALATGQIGALGLDVLLVTNPTGPVSGADSTAWLGTRYALIDIDGGAVQIAPVLRLALPLSRDSAPSQLEPSAAIGGPLGPWSWLVNLGGRARLHEEVQRTFVDRGQIFLSAGGTRELTGWLRAVAAIDVHVLIDDEAAAAGGLAAGLEAGTVVFGSLGGHISPFTSTQGLFSVQAGFGIRAGE